MEQAPQAQTVAEQWEEYAKKHRHDEGIGDAWSNPALIGMDVEPERVVPHLVFEVAQPFLGSPAVLLEIGSGGGRFTGPLLDIAGRVIASDTAPTMIDIIAERYANRANLDTLVLDGEGLAPLGDATIDAVFSYGVFVHLQAWDLFNYLTEIRRVLRPGGKAIIQHANTVSELGIQKFLKEVPLSVNKPKLAGTFGVMTPELMGTLVHHAGLTLEACRTDIARRDGISFMTKPS